MVMTPHAGHGGDETDERITAGEAASVPVKAGDEAAVTVPITAGDEVPVPITAEGEARCAPGPEGRPKRTQP